MMEDNYSKASTAHVLDPEDEDDDDEEEVAPKRKRLKRPSTIDTRKRAVVKEKDKASLSTSSKAASNVEKPVRTISVDFRACDARIDISSATKTYTYPSRFISSMVDRLEDAWNANESVTVDMLMLVADLLSGRKPESVEIKSAKTNKGGSGCTVEIVMLPPKGEATRTLYQFQNLSFRKMGVFRQCLTGVQDPLFKIAEIVTGGDSKRIAVGLKCAEKIIKRKGNAEEALADVEKSIASIRAGLAYLGVMSPSRLQYVSSKMYRNFIECASDEDEDDEEESI